MAAGKARRIVCMCGAGISVSAGGSTLHAATLRRKGCQVTLHLLMLALVQPPSELSCQDAFAATCWCATPLKQLQQEH